MRAQTDEERKKDKSFWAHDTWAEEKLEEENEDLDYVFEDQEDIVDSDFDDTEDEEETGPVDEGKRRRASRAAQGRRGYVDPAKKRKKAPAPASKKAQKRRRTAVVPNVRRQRTFRSSTQQRIAESQANRELEGKRQKLLAAKRKARNANREVTVFTQEELLRQAARTEVENRRSLELMLRMEDDRKSKSGPKAPYLGPLITFRSRIGEGNTVTFKNYEEIPSVINSKASPPPEKPRCVVTGLVAKYRDPKTGKPYATIAAFKKLRPDFR